MLEQSHSSLYRMQLFKLVTKKSFEKSVRISSSKMNDIVTKENWQRFELIIFLEHTQTAVGQND